jgi:raffinose/stachyose/melibiose transport system substrate-binding protein
MAFTARTVRGARFIAAFAALALAASATGCGSGSSSDPGTSASKPSITTDTGEVTWWGWNPDAAPAQDYIKAFNAKKPGIKVTYKYFPYTDYLNSLRLGVSSGEGPDVFGIQAGAMTQQYAPFAEDLTPYVSATHGADWAGRYYDLAVEPLQRDGKQVALSWAINAAGYLWYNKTLFDKLGVVPPKTLQEWKDVNAKLSAAGVTPYVHGAKDSWVNVDMFTALAHETAGDTYFKAIAGQASFTDPKLVEAMTTWKSLFSDGIMQKGALGISQYPDAVNQWRTGKAGMILLGTWNADAMSKIRMASEQKALGFSENWEFLPTAFPDINGDGKSGALFGDPDVGLAMSARSQNKAAAWEFVDFMTGQEAGATLVGKSLNIPGLKSVPLDQSVVFTRAQKDALATIAKDIQSPAGERQIPNADLEKAVGDALGAVAAGSKSPADALADVQGVSEKVKRG